MHLLNQTNATTASLEFQQMVRGYAEGICQQQSVAPLNGFRCQRATGAPMKISFFRKILINCFSIYLIFTSQAIAGPYDCSWFYEGNIKFEHEYLETLFAANESPNLVYYLAQFDRFEETRAPAKHALSWRRARFIRALSDPGVDIFVASKVAKPLGPLNFQVGDYSPIRAALECGSIKKVKLVLALNGYRDYDVFDGLDGKPTREFILVRTLLERESDAIEILRLFDDRAFMSGVINEIKKDHDLINLSPNEEVRNFLKRKLKLATIK